MPAGRKVAAVSILSMEETAESASVSMATLEEEVDETGKSMLDLVKSGQQEWDKMEQNIFKEKSKDISGANKDTEMETDQQQQNEEKSNKDEAEDTGIKKIKIKPLDALVQTTPQASSNSSDFTIGDIVEHGDFVSSDESGVMHLKITNVMSVDESITGCTVSEDDRDVFANIQIASVTTLIDEDLSVSATGKEKSTSSSSCQTTGTTTPAAAVASSSSINSTITSHTAVSDSSANMTVGVPVADAAPSLKIVNLQSLTSVDIITPGTSVVKVCFITLIPVTGLKVLDRVR